MTHNHDFINCSLLAIKEAVDSDITLSSVRDWRGITNAFYMFSDSLLAHIKSEDTVFYDEAEINVGENSLFYRLISDHIQIKELVEGCRNAIELNKKNSFSSLFEQLVHLVEEHTIREEAFMSSSSEKLEKSATKVISLLRNLHIH